MDLKPGDVLRHKATGKRCVVKWVRDNQVVVTTQDDEVKFYVPEELEKLDE